MTQVAIYNLGGEQVIGRVSLRQAIKMLHRRVARVHTPVEGETFGPYEKPSAVELTKFVFTKWLFGGKSPHYSRSLVLQRDRYTCAYCGGHGDTIDHVVPKCQGGETSWTNCVTACFDCNNRKSGRTWRQANMPLRFEPFVPTLSQLI